MVHFLVINIIEIRSDIVCWLQPELYLCTPIRVDFARNYYIIGFEPNATMQTAHHMLIYGCTKPGSSKKQVWNCGEMANAGNIPDTAPACREGTQVININATKYIL